MRALAAWLDAAAITDGRCSAGSGCRPGRPGWPPALPAIGKAPLTPRSIARIIQARAAAAGFGRASSPATASSAARSAPACSGRPRRQLKRLGRHKSFDVLGEYLEFGNLFDGHPLRDLL